MRKLNWRRRLREETGGAVVEYPLIAVLISLVALFTIQLCLVVHTHNCLLDAAAQGARFAAQVGNTPTDGAQRAEEIVRARLPSALAARAEASEDRQGRVRVTLYGSVPLLTVFGPPETLVVHGNAISERALQPRLRNGDDGRERSAP
ncbi:pilus assembly protein [Dermabacteraceae bacterium TAE3-ERU27]|nr:pilus assembly protein [Dermabacteraceae bacterium TAE3-ERU27]